jgi:RNA polymerase sigma-70 factor (ECF subfamily)
VWAETERVHICVICVIGGPFHVPTNACSVLQPYFRPNFLPVSYVLPSVDLNNLLALCRDGDQLAWEALVRAFQGRVYGIAFHYLGDPEDARDTAQEIFVRIYQNLTREISEQHFVPWVIRMARNVCIDHLRKRKARPPSHDLEAETMSDLADQRQNPEEQWIAGSRKRIAARAMQKLNCLNREIILLKDILGLSLDEISALLKVPVGTVKSRCNRARIELAEKVLALRNPRLNSTGRIR